MFLSVLLFELLGHKMLYHGRCYSSLSKLPVLIWVLNYGNVAQLARFFEVRQVLVKNHIILENCQPQIEMLTGVRLEYIKLKLVKS